jgi:hypothetical protein
MEEEAIDSAELPVGTRILVQWPLMNEYYPCVIKERLSDGRVKVCYKDGDELTLFLVVPANYKDFVLWTYKYTAHDPRCGLFLEDGRPNVQGCEHFRPFIQHRCNNVLLTAEGDTIPIEWMMNGTIKTVHLLLALTNGSEIGFKGEKYFIRESDRCYGFGRSLNQGLHGGGSYTGVHGFGVLAIEVGSHMRKRTLGYSNSLQERKLKELTEASLPFPCHLVTRSEEKQAVLLKMKIYRKSRGEVCCARNEKLSLEDEMNKTLYSNEEWVHC